MNNIKIIRFKSSEDIVASVEILTPETILVMSPMYFNVSSKETLQMGYWLPVGVIVGNQTILNMSDILFMSDANAMFSEYYMNVVTDMDKHIEDEIGDNYDDNDFDAAQATDDLMKQLMRAKDNGGVH